MKIANTDLGELFPLALGTSVNIRRWKDEGEDKVFNTFLDNGGNVIDTARIYNFLSGSEETLGRWIAGYGRRNETIIISKGGHPTLGPAADMHKFRLSKEEMESDLHETLRDLRTDHIDIYLYHRDDTARPVEELMETMQDFVRAGKIRYYGVSNWTLPRILEAQAYCERMGYRGIVLNQSLFNVGSDNMLPLEDDTLLRIDREMQAYHKEIAGTAHDILAAGYMAIASGFFQKYLAGEEENVRSNPYLNVYLTDRNLQIAAELAASAAANGRTITQEVLNFFNTLDFPCLALFGPRNSEGLLEAMAAFR